MAEERSLRDELESLQVHARTLRDELAAGASPEFLRRREQLTREVERRTTVLSPLEAHADGLEAEVTALEARAAKLRGELARVEQQRLPPGLAIVPVALTVVLVPALVQANESGAWFLGGLTAALAGLLLGLAYAQPTAVEAPLVPSLGRNVFFNPAAWSFVVLLPALFVAAVSLELQPGVRWANPSPLAITFFEALAAAIALLAAALAARRVSTRTARSSLLLSSGLLFLFAVRGHFALVGLFPSSALTEVGLRAALLVPILTAGLLVATPLFSLRRVGRIALLVAGLASIASSGWLARHREPVRAPASLGPFTFLESEWQTFSEAERLHVARADALAADERAPHFSPAARAHLQESTRDAKRVADAARARLSDDLTLVLLGLHLGLAALLASFATRSSWLVRAAAAVPLVVLLAAMNLRNVW